MRTRDGQAWPRVDEAPVSPGSLIEHDAAVCAVLRHTARHGLGVVDAWDLAAMLGLDLDTAVQRAGEAKP